MVHGRGDRRLHGFAEEAGDAARLVGRLEQLHLQASLQGVRPSVELLRVILSSANNAEPADGPPA